MEQNLRTAPSSKLFFHGRPGDPRLGEWVAPVEDLATLKTGGVENVVLIGCPDDTGVIRNLGRSGAKEGPDSIRSHFYKMTLPMDTDWETKLSVFDHGNAIPHQDILETHRRVRILVKESVKKGTVISLGGGHDFAAPTFMGMADGVREGAKREAALGLINVDAHLDVRPLEEDKPHSGTAFRMLLEGGFVTGPQFVEFGIRSNRNARQFYQYCKEKKVEIVTLESIRRSNKSAILSYAHSLKSLSRKSDYLVTTFCMDACSEAEGTSAAPVLGFSAWEMCEMAYLAGREKKVRLFEIVEVAPPLDPTGRSSRIAAEMIYFFLRGRAEV